MSDDARDASAAYAALVDEQLQEEKQRKLSFEARGLAVITTSGVLVSLQFGLAAVVTKSAGFQIEGAARFLLMASSVLFLLAALLSLGCNWPRNYHQVALSELSKLVSEPAWNSQASVASRRVAEVHVKLIDRARKLNASKGRLLIAAISCEVLAVTTLSGSVFAILAG